MHTADERPTVTAHRGSSAEAPENTLAAIRLAIEDGADVCEIDVFQAGDGTLVVTHDPSFRRVAGVDLDVWNASAAQIAALDAGAWFDERFRGEPVPTLDQVIDAAAGRLGLNLELKVHGREQHFAEAVAETVHRHALGTDCVLTSMDADILREVRRVDPSLRIGAILSTSNGGESERDVDVYSVERQVATASFLEQARRDGREVHVWTVNERADLDRFALRGADSLITDHPRLAREVLDARRLSTS